MADVHATAIVAQGGRFAEDVVVGPFCIVGPDVVLEAGVVLHAHVVVAGRTRLGAGTQVYPFASLGQPGQIYKNQAEVGMLEVGARCEIREHVTVNCGSPRGDLVTRIGEDCMLMVGAHVAHDCQVGRSVVFANNATLGGHVTVGDHVFFGGLSAVHQFCRIGEHAMISGLCGVRGDLMPFGLATGAISRLQGLNIVGLRRRNFGRERIAALRAMYRHIFIEKAGTRETRLAEAAERWGEVDVVARVIAFIREGGDRSLVQPRLRASLDPHDGD